MKKYVSMAFCPLVKLLFFNTFALQLRRPILFFHIKIMVNITALEGAKIIQITNNK
jgi:hypothetical protein